MATKTTVVTYDDLSREPGARTIHFSFDGVRYEIDLTDDNAAKLRALLGPYTSVARIPSPRRGPSGDRGSEDSAYAVAKARRGHLADVRTWWRAQGHDIPDRGRVPSGVLDAYDRFHSSAGDRSVGESAIDRTHAATHHAATATEFGIPAAAFSG